MSIPPPIPVPQEDSTPLKNLGSGPTQSSPGSTKVGAHAPDQAHAPDAPPAKRKPGRPPADPNAPTGVKGKRVRGKGLPKKTSPDKRRKEVTEKILNLPADVNHIQTGPLLPDDYRRAISMAGGTPFARAPSEAKRRMLAIGRMHAPEIMARMANIALNSRDERAAIAAGNLVLDRVYGKPKEAPPEATEDQEKKKLDLKKLMQACSADELVVLRGLFGKMATMQKEADAHAPTVDPDQASTAGPDQDNDQDNPESPLQQRTGAQPAPGAEFEWSQQPPDQLRAPTALKSGFNGQPCPIEIYAPDEPTPADQEADEG